MQNCNFIGRRLFKCFLLLASISVVITIAIYMRHTLSATNLKYYPRERFNLTVSTSQFQFSKARFDNNRMIRIYEWRRTARLWESLMEKFDVCLATQGSVDRIWSIAEVAEKWQGPISLAVYISTSEEWLILNSFISYLERCSDMFRDTVSVQVAVPITLTVIEYENKTDDLRFHIKHSCQYPKEMIGMLMKIFLPEGKDPHIPYLQNHMRNIARKTCGTEWVLMTDVDIVPRDNSALMLQEFFESPSASKCVKCAFVIPTFELDYSVTYPKTKAELAAYSRKGYARPFHLKVYNLGHAPTNYSRWCKTNMAEGPVIISHFVDPKKMKHYEPFYISSDKIPAHDERFIGYGFTRNSQVMEAKMMGWNFTVVSPIFAIHWGLQTSKTLYTPTTNTGKNMREAQNQHNYKIYKDLVSELTAKQIISNLGSKNKKFVDDYV